MDLWTIAILAIDVAIIVALFKVRSARTEEPRKPLLQDTMAFLPAAELLSEVAARLGMECRRRGLARIVVGVIGDAEVRIEPLGIMFEEASPSAADLKVTVELGGLPQRLLIHTRSGGETWAIERGAHKPPIQTGDPAFDARFVVSGPEEEVRALLGAAAREALGGLEGHLVLEHARIAYTAKGLLVGSEHVESMVRRLVEAAEKLVRPVGSLVHNLQDNALHDPQAGVRRANLEILTTAHSDRAECKGACRAGLQDWSAEVRLVASIHSGEEGFDVCEALAVGDGVSDAVRIAALVHAGSVFPGARSIRILGPALAAQSTAVREAAIRVAGSVDDPHIPALLICQIPKASPRTLALIAESLGTLGPREAEPHLLSLTDHPVPLVAIAATYSLGRVGGAESVPKLLALSKDKTTHSDVRHQAMLALDLVRTRLKSQPGSLSIVGASLEVGAVSFAKAGTGALSTVAVTRDEPLVDDLLLTRDEDLRLRIAAATAASGQDPPEG